MFSDISVEQLLDFNNVKIEVNMRQHLAKVYSTLALTIFCSFIGSCFYLYFHFGGFLSAIATLGWFVMMILHRYNKTRASEGEPAPSGHRALMEQFGMLIAFGFFLGCTIGPILEMAIAVDPSIVVTAFLATTSIFICFTASAMFDKEGTMYYLAQLGVLSSAVSALFVVSAVNAVYHNPFLYSVSLYGGMLLFCAYVLVDTKIMLEKIANGDEDFVWHAVELFIDFVAIFLRVVLILVERRSGGGGDKDDD